MYFIIYFHDIKNVSYVESLIQARQDSDLVFDSGNNVEPFTN